MGSDLAAAQAGASPKMIPTRTHMPKATATTTGLSTAGIINRISAAMGSEHNTPTAPPSRQMITASIKNWMRMVRRLAPTALRKPISFVRSLIETNMMFITPIPPTTRASVVRKRPIR